MADLNALAVFGTVVDAGSFSEAARRLGIPVSTVSRRVADLERELQVQLLERSTRKLRLTPVGGELLRHATATLDVQSAVVAIAGAHRATVTGTLRVSTPPSISHRLIAPIVAAVQTAHPQLHVHVLVTERLVDLIAEGVDAAFIVGDVTRDDLDVYPLLRYRHRVVAAPAYLARAGTPERPEELLEHPLLSFSRWLPESTWTLRNRDVDAARTITFRPYVSMNDYDGLAARLLDGAGIGELPPLVRPDLVDDGRLVEVMPSWRFAPNDLKVVHVSGRYVTRAVRAFVGEARRLAPVLFPAWAIAAANDA